MDINGFCKLTQTRRLSQLSMPATRGCLSVHLSPLSLLSPVSEGEDIETELRESERELLGRDGGLCMRGMARGLLVVVVSSCSSVSLSPCLSALAPAAEGEDIETEL